MRDPRRHRARRSGHDHRQHLPPCGRRLARVIVCVHEEELFALRSSHCSNSELRFEDRQHSNDFSPRRFIEPKPEGAPSSRDRGEVRNSIEGRPRSRQCSGSRIRRRVFENPQFRPQLFDYRRALVEAAGIEPASQRTKTKKNQILGVSDRGAQEVRGCVVGSSSLTSRNPASWSDSGAPRSFRNWARSQTNAISAIVSVSPAR